MQRELSLFPLNNVLYPGGVLSLQIFEPRYLSMVSDCLSHNKPFVVVLISEGQEMGKTAKFNKIGTLATIKDFNQNKNGLLEIVCRGQALVRILDYKINQNELIVGQVEEIHSIENVEFLAKYQILSDFLKAMIQREGMRRYRDSLEEDWDNPEWLSYRLSEILPLSQEQHYQLLTISTHGRFKILKKIMVHQGWL